MDKFLKTAVLVTLGIFLYTRITNDTILFYIHQRFVIFTLTGALTLLLVGGSYYLLPAHTHHPEHEHEHGTAVSWWGLLIVVLPVILGLLVPPQPLGAVALVNREVNLQGWNVNPATAVDSPTPRFPTIPPLEAENEALAEGQVLDWWAVLQTMATPDLLHGREAQLAGFVYRDDRFSPDTFMVGRFWVACCVADATALGVLVQWPDTLALPVDQWVMVNGRFQTGSFQQQTIPLLIATDVQPIDTPDQPYFYR